MPKWQGEEHAGPDPLAKYQRQPVISTGGPSSTYVGRVIVELWDTGGEDWRSMAVSADAAVGDDAALLQRVAAALPTMAARRKPFTQG
jgi:hypothetical protein